MLWCSLSATGDQSWNGRYVTGHAFTSVPPIVHTQAGILIMPRKRFCKIARAHLHPGGLALVMLTHVPQTLWLCINMPELLHTPLQQRQTFGTTATCSCAWVTSIAIPAAEARPDSGAFVQLAKHRVVALLMAKLHPKLTMSSPGGLVLINKPRSFFPIKCPLLADCATFHVPVISSILLHWPRRCTHKRPTVTLNHREQCHHAKADAVPSWQHYAQALTPLLESQTTSHTSILRFDACLTNTSHRKP